MSKLRGWIDWFFIAVGLGGIWFFKDSTFAGDGRGRAFGVGQFLEAGTFNDTKYSLIGPLFGSPLFFFGKAIHSDPFFWLSQYNFLIFGLALVGFYFALRSVVDNGVLGTFLLLLVFGSMYPNHVRYFYGEVFTSLMVAGGLLLVVQRRAAFAGWVGVVLGTANAPATLAASGLVVVRRIVRDRKLRYVAVVFATVALILLENKVRRGDFFSSGYDSEREHGVETVMPFSGRPGFSYPWFLGVLSLLFSFGKGLFFYVPGILVPLRAESKIVDDWYRYLLLYTAGLVAVYASWWSWYGGNFWGPRFLLIACIPAALALAHAIHRPFQVRSSLVTYLVLTFTLWVAFCGLRFGNARGMEQCWSDNYALEHLCWYAPEFSGFILPVFLPWFLDDWVALSLFAAAHAWLAFPIYRNAWQALDVRAHIAANRTAGYP